MKLCFNQATSMGCSDLETDLRECEKNAYDFIEIRLDKLRDYLSKHTVADLKAFFAKSHLKPYAFNALEGIDFRTPEDWDKLMTGLDLFCEVGKEINCDRVVVVPTDNVGRKTVKEIQDESVKAIKAIDARAKKNGWPMRMAVEFVGYPSQSINTFNQAYGIVKACNMDNVGMVLDCFHFYAMGSRVADLADFDISKLFILHIDDSEDLPVGALRDDMRLWPGEGCIDLKGIFTTLKNKGWDYMASVELFRPEYYKLSPADNIRIAKEKSIACLSKYWKF